MGEIGLVLLLFVIGCAFGWYFIRHAQLLRNLDKSKRWKKFLLDGMEAGELYFKKGRFYKASTGTELNFEEWDGAKL